MSVYTLPENAEAQFDQDGYVLIRNLFDAEEMRLLFTIGKADQEKAAQIHDVLDAAGNTSKIWLTSDTEREDIYKGFCHSRRIVDTMERLMGDEVYLYHYKMMVKEPRVRGACEWHQDYGYWYDNGCLFPDMASCYIAVDRAYEDNGCLQVLKGSHRIGRIEHGKYGDQTGADPERIALAEAHLERVYCVMEPGDALFFHANLLHRSDPNRSDDPRWSLICCYNTRHNPCRDLEGYPSYRPLAKWDDTRIKEIGQESIIMRRPDLDNLPVLPPFPEGYLLRTFLPDDLSGLTALMQTAFPEIEWDEARAEREFIADTNVKRTFVVVCDGAIVATASALVEPENHPGAGIIHWVAAHPEHQGKGLGLIVSLAVLEEFVRLDCRDVLLHTHTHRLPAIKTYTKLGFSFASVRE